MIVVMHFGDGTFKELEMTQEDPENAVREADDWVTSNAWFEVQDEQGQILARRNLGF